MRTPWVDVPPIVTDLADIASGVRAQLAAGSVPLADSWRRTVVNPAAASILTIPGVYIAAQSTVALTAATDYYLPIWCEDTTTFDQVVGEVTTAGTAGATARVALFAATQSWQPNGNPIEDFGTVLIDTNAVKTWAPAAGTRALAAGRYLLAINPSANATFRSLRGNPVGGLIRSTLSTTAFIANLTVGRAHAAFPSPGTAWTTAGTSGTQFDYPLALRVTAEG